ncbi:MAG: hypothetical protein IJ206_04270 [Oscillospiraceae bacterium]|nr:hypothetical protein [Oscillospiraceae bacterium]
MSIEKYADIIDSPHHVSQKHPQMPMAERAAQFNPFAALTGYGDAVKETARLTDQKMELTESRKEALDQKLREIVSSEGHPAVTIVYFVPDEHKDGGRYVEITDTIEKVDPHRSVIKMGDGTIIPIDNISDVSDSE